MKFFYFTTIFLILLGVLTFFSIPTIKEMKRSKVIESEISALEAEAERLNADNNFLKEKIEYLKSDYYKESVAKDRLSLRNKGEKLVVVHPKQKVLGASSESMEQDAAVNEKDDQGQGLPNYRKWWNIISGQ